MGRRFGILEFGPGVFVYRGMYVYAAGKGWVIVQEVISFRYLVYVVLSIIP